MFHSRISICRSLQSISKVCLSLTSRSASNQSPINTLTQVSHNDGICNIVLHNSKKRNSLSASMLDELKQNLTEASFNKDVQVIILSASGPVFSAGHNLKELLAEEGREFHEQLFKSCSEVMCLVQDIDIPVISQVRGLATAAGCQLIASCDLTIASENAKFATPGVSIGLFCSTPAVAIARALPRKIAMQMLLTAEPITAQEALTHGLVNKVVPDEKLEETTLGIAKRLCTFSRPVVALGKRCFYEQITKPRDEAYRIAESAMVHNLSYSDAQEGIKAFLEKRKPNWTHS